MHFSKRRAHSSRTYVISRQAINAARWQASLVNGHFGSTGTRASLNANIHPSCWGGNLTAAAAMMISLGYPLNQVAGICLGVRAIPGRLELVETTGGQGRASVLIDYAHTPDALEKTLETCRDLLSEGGKLICVFGCGGDRDPTKRPIMGQIAARIADQVWITSDNPRTENPMLIIENILNGTADENSAHVCVQADRALAIKEAIRSSKEQDIVLIAGKGHEDYQIVGTTKYPFSDSAIARQILSDERNI
ncbi:hypothetical protein EBR21_10480 [bacterium]|nr:hypothetical protein [bacterium]